MFNVLGRTFVLVLQPNLRYDLLSGAVVFGIFNYLFFQ